MSILKRLRLVLFLATLLFFSLFIFQKTSFACVSGSRQCVSGGYQICNQCLDSPLCTSFTWGSTQSCSSGQVCVGSGSCTAPCSSGSCQATTADCPNGADSSGGNYCNLTTNGGHPVCCAAGSGGGVGGPTATPTPTPYVCGPSNCSGTCSGPLCNGPTCMTQGHYCSGNVCQCGWAGGSSSSGCSPVCNACTSSNCGGNITGPTCNGTTCMTQGDYCTNPTTCGHGWAGGTAVADSLCNGGAGCINPPVSQPPPPTSCVPNCSARVCGGDGCGGSCGVCPAGDTCNSTCCGVPAPANYCQTQGFICGTSTYLGCTQVNCGTCPNSGACTSDQKQCINDKVIGTVYVDYNKNGVQDPGEPGYPNANLTADSGSIRGGGTFSYSGSTDYTGAITILIPPGGSPNGPFFQYPTTYDVNLTVPTGYTASTTNPATVTYSNWVRRNPQVSESQTVNFGIFGPPPPVVGSPTPTSAPTFNVTGTVFVDNNKDAIYDKSSESPYSGSINVTSSDGTIATYPSQGNYAFALTAGTYTISYAMAQGYQPTEPGNGPPQTFNITVGPGCTVGGSKNAVCTANNISDLDFGITNSVPWIQSTGSDIRIDSGINNQIPAGASCGPVASKDGNGGTPGIIYSGNGSATFGGGTANSKNWVVGGLSFPEPFTPVSPNVIRTSYSYVSSILAQNGTTPTTIDATMFNSSLKSGVYKTNGDLNLTGSGFTVSGNKQIVVLVNGNLTVSEDLLVNNGSTLFFTVAKDITVSSNVGVSANTVCTVPTTADGTSTGCNLEGYYSADGSFVLQGSNTCPTPDSRLNVAGAIVVNAALSTTTPGSLINNRDLCAGDAQCPVFSITERPDFILNSPFIILNSRRVFQEVAP